MKTHKDLKVWQDSVDFVTEIYTITNEFPKSEIYGLTNQIRRCTVSIPSNIAEGSARNTNKDKLRFLFMSLGSLAELETQILIAKNLTFISEEKYNELDIKIKSLFALLNGYMKFVKGKIEN